MSAVAALFASGVAFRIFAASALDILLTGRWIKAEELMEYCRAKLVSF